jgi:hypothetical protein
MNIRLSEGDLISGISTAFLGYMFIDIFMAKKITTWNIE